MTARPLSPLTATLLAAFLPLGCGSDAGTSPADAGPDVQEAMDLGPEPEPDVGDVQTPEPEDTAAPEPDAGPLGCTIGGVTYADGAADPANGCASCAVATSTAAWTPSADGAPCDGGACVEGQCVTAPTLTGVEPACLPTAGGAAVTLKGQHFLPGATVTFDEAPGTDTQVANENTLTTRAPTGAPGPVAVAVKNVLGEATSRSDLLTRYTAVPFADLAIYEDGRPINAVVAADFDGDLVTDVLAGRAESEDGLRFYRGLDNGTLVSGGLTPTGGGVTELVAGDFNGDKHLDVAYTGLGNTVDVVLGAGDGTFGAAQKTPTGGLLAHAVAVGTLDAGDTLDLIVTHEGDPRVAVLLGQGDGTFANGTPLAVPDNAIEARLADLNGDTHLDLATLSYSGGSATVFLGDGAGGFGTPTTYPTGEGASAAFVADLTGDGVPDLVVSHQSAAGIQLLRGVGDGTFQAAQQVAPQPTVGFALADVDGDTRLDLITDSGGEVSVRYGQGNGAFPCPQTGVIQSDGLYVSAADLNGDGRAELLVHGDKVRFRLGVLTAFVP